MATTWSYVRPDKSLESPFSAKHLHRHQPFLRPNYSIVVDELDKLYQFTTQETSQQFLRQVWVSSKVPFGHIRLELGIIQGSVANERCLGMDCFNIAVKNMATEDADNFQNTKCKGWRHYVYPICVMNDNSGAENSGAQVIPNHKFACESTDYDTYGSHLVLIPVLHAAHWTLYAFDMCGRKLSILDCSSSPHPEVRNEEIRLQICSALNQTMRTPSDKSKNDFTCWKFQYPDVPRQQNREDSGFVVFNFMRLWDGHRLHSSFKTESRELRMEFLAYLLSCKENGATLPKDVLSWISNISDGRKMARKNRQPWALYPINRQLWEDAMKGELVVEENARTATSQAQLGGEADENSGSNAGVIIRRSHSGATSEANGEPHTAGTSTGAIENSGSNAHVLPKRFRGVTPEGDGVLHIAARHGHVGLVRTICSIAGVPIEPETQPGDSDSVSGSQPVIQPDDSASRSPVTQPADSASVSSSQPATQPADSASVSSSQSVTQPASSTRVLLNGRLLKQAWQGAKKCIFCCSHQQQPPPHENNRVGPHLSIPVQEDATEGTGELVVTPPHQQQQHQLQGVEAEIEEVAEAEIIVVTPPHQQRQLREEAETEIEEAEITVVMSPHQQRQLQGEETEIEEVAEAEIIAVTRPHQQHQPQGVETEIEEVVETSPQAMLNAGGLQQQRHEEGGVQFVELLRLRNHRGETCLHEAVRIGHTKLVRLLIEVDAKVMNTSISTPTLVQIVDEEGTSPLYLATTLGHKDIVEALTTNTSTNNNYYPAASSAGPAGKTALHAAVVVSKELCELLLSWNMSLASRADESGKTPLHYVGRSALRTRIILEKDPSSGYCADSEGSLPIHVAASFGRLHVIKALLEKCIDCDTWCNASGQTFLHVAIDKGHDNIVKHVCKEPRLARILNMRDHNGDTALHLAVQNGKDSIFYRLFEKREVCLNFINKQQYTPLDLAFLSVEKEGYRKVHRQWIRNDLLEAGATFCTCRPDHFSKRRMIASVQEYEKEESERLSKSAGLLAAAAVLIVSLSFNVTINVADKDLQAKIPPWGKNNNATAVWVTSTSARGKIFADLVSGDVMAMVYAVLAIFCCTVAGFPTSRLKIRFGALILGGFTVIAAAASIIGVFVDGLTLVYPQKNALGFTQALILCITLVILHAFVTIASPLPIISHVPARYRRFGSLARALLPTRRRGTSILPFFHVLFLVEVWFVLSYVAYRVIKGFVEYSLHELSRG